MNKIGIIGAMELEVAALKDKMEIRNVFTKASMEFLEGTLNGTEVIITRSGVGKTNAALCSQILADLYNVTHIINTGVAGSLNASLNIGDILVSSKALYHDVDATIFGYQLGEIPQLGIREFPANEDLQNLAIRVCKEVNPDIHVQTGRVVSGDQFISSKEVKQRLITDFQGDCTEMEGAAIAHAAYLNHTPFVIIRAISDKADDSATMDYPTFEREAAKHSARLVERMLSEL
jgi:adenosylhomocysteine nucleosidase